MTDINQKYSLGGLGARLKTAREAMNLSQKDAAFKLHLNPTILEILETENFQKAPPATFMRGYLKSYGRLLNFNEEEINTALMQSGLEYQTRAPIIPTIPTETLQISDRYLQWISTGLILGLFIFVGVWWGFHSSSNSVNTLTRPTPVATPPASPPQVAQPPSTVTPPPVAATTQTTQPPVTTPPPAAAPTPAVPALPSTSPLAITPVPPNAAISNTETSKKHSRHHKQDSTISGVTMALPEPGL